MASKIKVHGLAQGRTVLGIINAYLVLNPNATKEDLDNAFPSSLNPGHGKSIFADLAKKDEVKNLEHNYFEKDDEAIKLNDGTSLALCEAWPKEAFLKAVEKAKEYGIEVSEFHKTSYPGQKGSFWFEKLNGFDSDNQLFKSFLLSDEVMKTIKEETPKDQTPKEETPVNASSSKIDLNKKEEPKTVSNDFAKTHQFLPKEELGNPNVRCDSGFWLMLLAILLLLAIFLFCLKDCGTYCPQCDNSKEEQAKALALKQKMYDDSVAQAKLKEELAIKKQKEDSIRKIMEEASSKEAISNAIANAVEQGISSNTSRIRFAQNSAEISKESNMMIEGILKFLLDNKDIRLKIIGHSSPEGDSAYNVELSKQRAESVVKQLIKLGVDASRLEFDGVGANQQCSDVPEENRRIEVKKID